ncbi:MAG: hypothetical protein R3F43_27460 [bacterium]
MGRTRAMWWLGGPVLLAGPARAEWPLYLGAGYVHSEVWGDAPTRGEGLEVTFGQSDPGGGLAALIQHDWYADDSARLALGGQIVGPMAGLELAWSRRRGDEGDTQGVQLAPYATFMGTVYLSGRFVFALDDGPHGNEYGFAVGLKFPYLLGEVPISFGHGRPLRDARGRPVAVRGRGLRVPRAPLPGVDARTRRALGEAWLADARMEHASVATFERLAAWLDALGAPAALVADARRAADDERRHAQACFAQAGRYLGQVLVAEPVEVPAGPPPSLAGAGGGQPDRGLPGGGAAAAQAACAAALAEDGPARAALVAIAADEAAHARLPGRRCWAGPRPGASAVRAAVQAARGRLPRAGATR